MTIDLFAINCGALKEARLVGFKGTELLGRPYEIDVFFTVPAGTDVRSAVGTRATITATRGEDAEALAWHGVFARLRLLHQTAERALYRGVLVPKTWLLRHSVRSHVFTRKKLKDFASTTLKHGGLQASDFRFNIDDGSYPEEEFVCQYRESHLDFVDRWLEREGLYYYFEQPEGDGKTEVMVVVDDKSKHAPLVGDGKVRYFPSQAGDVTAGERFRELHVDYDALPAAVLISDYNYANPTAPLAGEHAVSETGHGQIREYGYRVFTQGEATRLAGVKAQSMACRELTLHASGNALGLRAGYVFELEDGPSELPTKYLAIEVRHAGAVAGGSSDVARYTGLEWNETYRVEVVAIPADVQFRAPQSTPWPRIYGFENGAIDGQSESQYAQIDEQGRYLVRFKFDASELPDGSTSTYLRMMQPHGGPTEGHHFPLRKGTEVVVSFQGGDPDRPVISGVVPNLLRPSTVTSKNHTMNVLRTGGSNHMVIEDLEGKQHIDLYSPTSSTNIFMGGPRRHAFTQPPTEKSSISSTFASVDCSLYLFTEGSGGLDVGGSWWENVGASYWKYVGGNATIEYGGVHTINVDGDSNEFYNAHQNIKVSSGRNDKVVDGGMNQDITGGLTQTIKPGGSQTVTGGWTHKVTAQNKDDYGTWDTKSGAWTAHMASVAWDVDGNIGFTSPTMTITCPDVSIKGAKVSTESGVIKDFSPFTIETFGSKNAIGVQQLDAVAVVFGAWGIKTEAGGMATALIGLKGETCGFEATSFGVAFKTAGAKIYNAGVKVFNRGVAIDTQGFRKT